MRVRVHKARHEDAIARVESRFVGIGGFEFSRRADRDDLFIAHHDCTVFDDAKRAEGLAPLRAALARVRSWEEEWMSIFGNW